MLPKEHRLRHEKDIKALFAKGKSVFGIYTGIKFVKNKLPESRFTVVVGVKIAKRAVVRNKIKRKYRAILHERLDVISSGYDVLVLVKKESLTASHDEIKADFLKILKKASLLT